MDPQQLLTKVKQDYAQISAEFSKTRQNLDWPEIYHFKKYFKSGQTILDLGCGNGRLLNSLQDFQLNYFGLDNSPELLNFAKVLHPELADKFICAEMFDLPYSDNQFDVIVCLATFHHLPNLELRQKALAEMHRVLKPQGLVLMTNWCIWQKLFWQNFFNNFSLKSTWNDFFIPWKLEGQTINRYYHGFTKSELNKLFTSNYWEITENDFFPKNSWPKRNWFTVLKKIN